MGRRAHRAPESGGGGQFLPLDGRANARINRAFFSPDTGIRSVKTTRAPRALGRQTARRDRGTKKMRCGPGPIRMRGTYLFGAVSDHCACLFFSGRWGVLISLVPFRATGTKDTSKLSQVEKCGVFPWSGGTSPPRDINSIIQKQQ